MVIRVPMNPVLVFDSATAVARILGQAPRPGDVGRFIDSPDGEPELN